MISNPESDSSDPPPSPDARRWPWVVAVATLIIGFVVHALVAVSGKSATYDEPIHTLASWLMVNAGDFRVTPDHPALWRYVTGLGMIGQPLNVDLNSPAAMQILVEPETECAWSAHILYQDPNAMTPRYGERLIWRARLANSIFASLLGCLLARWAWAWGGRIAAVVALCMLAFDPNFLAHGVLMTNDVAATFMIALATYCAWRLGERMTWGRASAFVLACAAAVGIKFSCLLLAPMLGLPLLYRAISAQSWPVGRKPDAIIGTRPRRIAAVLTVCSASVLIAFASLWPVYHFRESPTSNDQFFHDTYAKKLLAFKSILYENRDNPDPLTRTDRFIVSQLRSFNPGPVGRILYWIQDCRLTPQAWSYGLTCMFSGSLVRDSFFMDKIWIFGSTWFFPVTIAVKTPLTTLLLIIVSIAAGFALIRRRIALPSVRWKLICLVVPPSIYLAIAMHSNLNIGLRHVLPLYVPAFVVCGVVAARLIAVSQAAKILIPAALTLLAVETTSAFPNYLAFFNILAGGERGGLKLLGDSNLDWGQDLPDLATWYKHWRAENPTRPFYLSYFGTADPRAFGIDYVNVEPGYTFDHTNPLPLPTDKEGGVLAISATHLQGGFVPTVLRPAMVNLRSRQPLAVINGSIYVYDLGPGRSK